MAILLVAKIAGRKSGLIRIVERFLVTHYYFYVLDVEFGMFFIKNLHVLPV